MVEEVRAYFLIPGTIVQVTEDDPSSGLSQIGMAGITVDLFALTRFLSKHAVKDLWSYRNSRNFGSHSDSDVGHRRGPDDGPRFQPGSRHQSDARREANTDA